jgi:hypothetical protein
MHARGCVDSSRVMVHGFERPVAINLAVTATVRWCDRETGAEMASACWSVLEAERDARALRAHGHENVRVEPRQ